MGGQAPEQIWPMIKKVATKCEAMKFSTVLEHSFQCVCVRVFEKKKVAKFAPWTKKNHQELIARTVEWIVCTWNRWLRVASFNFITFDEWARSRDQNAIHSHAHNYERKTKWRKRERKTRTKNYFGLTDEMRECEMEMEKVSKQSPHFSTNSFKSILNLHQSPLFNLRHEHI